MLEAAHHTGCPLCNRPLQSLADLEEDLPKAGAQLQTLSMDQVRKLRETPPRDKLHHRLLSDSEAAAAKAFGIALQVDDASVEIPKGNGIHLQAGSGRDHHILPHPAVFIAGTQGRIRFAHGNLDDKCGSQAAAR